MKKSEPVIRADTPILSESIQVEMDWDWTAKQLIIVSVEIDGKTLHLTYSLAGRVYGRVYKYVLQANVGEARIL